MKEMSSEPEWKPVSLYGVVGIFEEQSDVGKVAFAGYIKIIEEDGSVVGELIDVYGPSTIRGFLKGNKFKFQKKYTLRPSERPDKILVYTLERIEDNHFKGTCSVPGFPAIQIHTELWIFEIEKDAYYITAGPPTPEDKIEKLYKRY